MTLKSYFSPSVEAAIAQAARELGPEAMLVYSREAPAESRSWGRYEVVFGWEMNALSAEHEPRPQEGAQVSNPIFPPQPAAVSPPPRPTVSLHEWQGRLSAAGFNRPLVESIARRCLVESSLQLQGPVSPSFWRDLGEWIPIAQSSGLRRENVIVVAGPPGVGKTAALARLAYESIHGEGRAVHLVATDADRMCGGMWLERFANLTGSTFSRVDSLAGLEALLSSALSERLVLVEAAGWLTRPGAAWRAFRRRNPGVRVQVMLPVTHRLEDLRGLWSRFQALEPDRIIAARLDESRHCGAVCSVAAESRVALSYFSGGEPMSQRLERATLERVMAGVLGSNTGTDGGGA